MPARLLCKTGPLKGESFLLEGETTVGRGAGSTIVLPAKSVSSVHARIVRDEAAGGYFLEDLNSLNGTEIDGVPVEGRESLGRLHVITVAGFDFIYQGAELAEAAGEGAADPATAVDEAPVGLPPEWSEISQEFDIPAAGQVPEGTQIEDQPLVLPQALTRPMEPVDEGGVPEGTQIEDAPLPLPAALGGKAPGDAAPAAEESSSGAQGSGFALQVTHRGTTRRHPLHPGENRIGRADESDVQIKSPDVSRRHAVLVVSGSGVLLRDHGSRNRTFLDGRPVRGETALEVGTRIQFGSVQTELVELERGTS